MMQDDKLPEPPDSELLESATDVLTVVLGGVPGVGQLVNALDRSMQRVIRTRDRTYMMSVFQRFYERLTKHEEKLNELSKARLSTIR